MAKVQTYKDDQGNTIIVKTGITWGQSIRKYWQLYLLLVLPLLYLLIFKYIPMRFIIIAFKDYKLNTPIGKMPWAVTNKTTDYFKYFRKAFENIDFRRALWNTVKLNLLDLICGFPAPIIFALILNELCFKRFKKTVQTIAYMPHFLSWVIIANLVTQLFAPTDGLVNILITSLGGEAVPFLNDPSHWVATYVFTGVWQSFGWGSIIYLASIAGINTELYEAASVDGAGRFKKMWHITLPGIKPTIVVLLIMNLGYIMGGGFERPYAMKNNLVINVCEVISTYVYKNGIQQLKVSLTTAVGLFQSVVPYIFRIYGVLFYALNYRVDLSDANPREP